MRTRIPLAVVFLSASVIAQVSWKQRTPSRAAIAVHRTFAHDTKRDVYPSLVFDYTTRTLEMWQLRGTTWSKLSPRTMPVFNSFAKTVYDPRRDRVVLFATSITQPQETWEWDGSDWSQRATVQTPFLVGFELLFDEQRGVVTAVSVSANGIEVHDYDGASWTRRQVTNPPSWRAQFSCAIGQGGLLLLHGGVDSWNFVTDTWLLAGNRWVQIPGSGPSGRISAGMCYDPTRQRFVLMGGRTVVNQVVTTLSDTWEWNGTWTQREASNTAIARESHYMLWDPLRERCFSFGGALTWGGGDVIKSFSVDSSFDYGPNRPARFTSYGNGCASARTAPKLVEVTRPWVGQTAAFAVEGVAASTPLILFTGSSRQVWASLKLPLDLTALGMPGCFLNASLDLVTPAPSAVQYAIPNDRSLVGRSYFHQVAAIDAAANAAGLVLSAGVELVVGEG